LDELMNVQVKVASAQPEAVFHTPSTVTVVDREMIDKYHFLSIAEALTTVAGMEVYQTVIDKNVATARGVLQNFYANKVLLMINNVPTWQPIYGDGHLERIDIQDVERIEVLKGPASVLYGSNAYVGVINIILREVEETGVSAYTRVGYRNLGGSGANIRLRADDFRLGISANGYTEERSPYTMTSALNHPYNNDLSYQHSEEYGNRNFNVNASWQAHSVMVNNFNYNHTYLGAHPSYAGGGGTRVKNGGTLVNYRYNNQLNKQLQLHGNMTYDYFRRQFSLSADRVSQIRLAGDRFNAELDMHYEHSEQFEFSYGFAADNRRSHGHDTWDAVQDTLIRNNLQKDDNILEWATYVQVDSKIRAFRLLLGTRYTHNAHFGHNFSSRMSSVYTINDNNSVKLIYGRSYRVPTMFELYFSHPTVMGNRTLDPETSRSYEIAWLFGANKLFFQVLSYHQKYMNLIQRVTPSTGPPSEYRNEDELEGGGIELEVRYQDPKRINFFINYDYIAAIEDHSDANYRFVPDHTWSYGVNKNVQSFFIAANGKTVSSVDGHLAQIARQSLLNVHIGYTHTLNQLDIRHTFSCKNITDSNMWIAEYIRQTENVNAIPTTAFGRRFVYSVFVSF